MADPFYEAISGIVQMTDDLRHQRDELRHRAQGLEDIIVRASRMAESERAGMTLQILGELGHNAASRY